MPTGIPGNPKINDDGEFVRHQTSFREQIRADGSTAFQPAAGRYHLYVSYACPVGTSNLDYAQAEGS